MGKGKQKPRKKERHSQGPKLPFLLNQELASTTSSVSANDSSKTTGGSMFHVSNRKEARKAARKAKKMQNRANRLAHTSGRASNLKSQPQRLHASDQDSAPPRKKQRMAPVALHLDEQDSGSEDTPKSEAEADKTMNRPGKKPKARKTHFSELLTADVLKGADEKAMQAELDLQRQLAKKLGLKQKAKTTSTSALAGDVFREDLVMGSDSDNANLEDGALYGGSESSLAESEEDFADKFLEDTDQSGGEGGSDRDDDAHSQQSFDLDDSEVESDVDGSLEGTPGGHQSVEAKRRLAGVASTSGRADVMSGKYVPPAARLKSSGDQQSAKSTGILRRRLTGLVNKLSDPSLPGVAGEIVELFHSESRRDVTDIISELLLQGVAEGPRASDRFTCVTAALVSGVSARGDSIEFGANFVASLARQLELGLSSSDTLAQSNLGNLLAHLYMTDLLTANCLFSFLERLRKSFQEQDVAMIHLILKACGLKLRSDDSVAMKEFVVAVHATAAERKSEMSQRAEIMLELVVDVKNNRKSKSSALANTLESYLSQGSLRWLKESRVADTQLKNLTWERLIDPHKKGLWWLPQAGELEQVPGMGKLLQSQTERFGDDLLQQAAKQRMNTDVRRAIFCIIMGSEDYADASERLLRLPLKGESQREIVRVAMECCLQEKDWNPYYAALLGNILRSSQAHCVTAQFCLWDHLKALKGQQTRRAVNLARLIASLIISKALPFSALRAANLDALTNSMEEVFWQTLFERVLQAPSDQKTLIALLKPLAAPHLQAFAASMARYLHEDFTPTSVSNPAKVAENSKAARKILIGFKRSQ